MRCASAALSLPVIASDVRTAMTSWTARPNCHRFELSACADSAPSGVATMQHAFNELLHFLQQGISAIFHFVQMIWAWSVGQISALLAVPWQQWPIWKQILLVC